MLWWLLGTLLVIGALLFQLSRTRARRRRRAREIARELLPEVRGLMESIDPRGSGGGEPVEPSHYQRFRHELPRVFPKECLFAVETFYQCVGAYRDARDAMNDAFSEESDESLGDRIRAKDRRDRALKDACYTGEAALQELRKL